MASRQEKAAAIIDAARAAVEYATGQPESDWRYSPVGSVAGAIFYLLAGWTSPIVEHDDLYTPEVPDWARDNLQNTWARMRRKHAGVYGDCKDHFIRELRRRTDLFPKVFVVGSDVDELASVG